jgi:hypothetical protein
VASGTCSHSPPGGECRLDPQVLCKDRLVSDLPTPSNLPEVPLEGTRCRHPIITVTEPIMPLDIGPDAACDNPGNAAP